MVMGVESFRQWFAEYTEHFINRQIFGLRNIRDGHGSSSPFLLPCAVQTALPASLFPMLIILQRCENGRAG